MNARSLNAQYYYDYNVQVINAYKYIGQLKMTEAKQILDHEKLNHPNNLAVYHIENSIDFLELLISEDENLFDELEDNKDVRIDMLEKGKEDNPYYRYSIAEVNIQWAFARVKFHQYFAALFEVRKAYKLLEENQELYPDFLPNLVGLGFLHTLIGSIPENYRWVTDIVGVEGDMDQGIKELTTVLDSSISSENYAHLRAQSLLFLSFIHLNLHKDLTQAEQMRDQVAQYCSLPGQEGFSPILYYIYAKLLMKTGKNAEAIELLELYPYGDKNYYPMPYLYFMLGKARLYDLDPLAEQAFLDYLHHFKGQNFIKAAYMYLSWNALVHNNMEAYNSYKLMIRESGQKEGEPDKVAQDFSYEDRLPNSQILKGRLLFDGGNYQEAIELFLNQKTLLSLRDKEDSLEYAYRIARVYHEMGNIPLALSHYALSIENGSNEKFYYAANAALKSGQIYESREMYKEALRLYKLVRSMDFDQYEGSIKQKARAGRLRVQKKLTGNDS